MSREIRQSFVARRYRPAAALLALTLFVSPLRPARENPPPALALTLQDCISYTLTHNVDVAIAELDPVVVRAGVALARNEFLPQLDFSFSYGKIKSPEISALKGDVIYTNSDGMNLEVSQKLFSGATLSLGLSSNRTDTNVKYTTINPSFFSGLNLNLSQPLLQGFGPRMIRAGLIKAKRQLAIAGLQLKSVLMNFAVQAETAYWNLVGARESLQVVELSLQQSQEDLARCRDGERMGAKSALDVMNAEIQVDTFQDQLLNAQFAVEQCENTLKKIMNLPRSQLGLEQPIQPLDRPRADLLAITETEAVATALAERLEMAQQKQQVADNAFEITVQKNQLLPDLRVNFNLDYSGQSGTRLLFLNNDPLTQVVVGRIVSNRWWAFRDVFQGLYKNWSLRLSLSYPLANLGSHPALTQARVAYEKSRLAMTRQRADIEFEVRAALQNLRLKERQINSLPEKRRRQEKRQEVMLQRYRAGLEDNAWLLGYQKELVEARQNEIRALIDYNIARAEFERAIGTLLRARGLTVGDAGSGAEK